MRKFPKAPFEDLSNPARLFLIGILFLGLVQLLLGALPVPVQRKDAPKPVARPLAQLNKYPEVTRIRIHLELARAARRARQEYAAFFRKHPEQKYQVVLNHLNDKYALAVGKKYGLTRQELERIRQEGLKKRWLSVLPALTPPGR